jgi:hypothetical protein
MALQHLRSSTANKRPTPAAMSDGQLAMNTNLASPGLFLKDSNGDLVKVGPVHVGTTAPNATPAVGGQAGNSKGEQWLDTSSSRYVFKIWDGTAWRTEDGEFVNTSGDTMTGALGIIAGSAATPGVFFSGDTNTGIYSPGADQVAISTNGTGRLFIDSSGRLLAGTSTARSNFFGTTLSSLTQIEGTGGSTARGSISVLNNDVSNNPPYVLLGRSGAATLGSNAVVVSGSRLGTLTFHGADGTSFIEAATVAGEVDGTPGTNDMPGRLVFSTTADGAASPSERMRLTSAGLLGLGTSAPNYQLHVTTDFAVGASGFNQQLSFTNDTIQSLVLGTGYTALKLNPLGGNVGIGTSSPARTLDVTGTARISSVLTMGSYIQGTTQLDLYGDSTSSNGLRLDSSGRVGIGTTSPSQTLEVVGDARITNSAGATLIVNRTSNPGSVAFAHSGTETGQISAVSGGGLNFYIGSTPSLKATIDSSGRLLVGTSSASTATSASTARIQIVGHTAATEAPGRLVLRRNETSSNISVNEQIGQIYFGDNEAGEYALIECASEGTAGSGDYPGRLVFSTTGDNAASPTERMRIDSAGRTNLFSADLALEIHASAGAGTATALIDGRYSAADNTTGSGTRSFIVFTNGNVQNTNNSYGALSDIKLKENIVDANSQWSDLKSLQVRNYNLKEGQTHTQIGLVAQEAELVSPGLVSESPDRDADGNDLGTVTKSVNYSVLYMKAVKALQEAMERIETLEARLAVAGIE